MSTFTWLPSSTANVTESPAVLRASFGDGYEQRAKDGINSMRKVWNLQFNGRKLSEATEIREFLLDLDGTASFDWTDPDGETLRYVVEDGWQRSISAAYIQSFTLTFKQVFGE